MQISNSSIKLSILAIVLLSLCGSSSQQCCSLTNTWLQNIYYELAGAAPSPSEAAILNALLQGLFDTYPTNQSIANWERVLSLTLNQTLYDSYPGSGLSVANWLEVMNNEYNQTWGANSWQITKRTAAPASGSVPVYTIPAVITGIAWNTQVNPNIDPTMSQLISTWLYLISGNLNNTQFDSYPPADAPPIGGGGMDTANWLRAISAAVNLTSASPYTNPSYVPVISLGPSLPVAATRAQNFQYAPLPTCGYINCALTSVPAPTGFQVGIVNANIGMRLDAIVAQVNYYIQYNTGAAITQLGCPHNYWTWFPVLNSVNIGNIQSPYYYADAYASQANSQVLRTIIQTSCNFGVLVTPPGISGTATLTVKGELGFARGDNGNNDCSAVGGFAITVKLVTGGTVGSPVGSTIFGNIDILAQSAGGYFYMATIPFFNNLFNWYDNVDKVICVPYSYFNPWNILVQQLGGAGINSGSSLTTTSLAPQSVSNTFAVSGFGGANQWTANNYWSIPDIGGMSWPTAQPQSPGVATGGIRKKVYFQIATTGSAGKSVLSGYFRIPSLTAMRSLSEIAEIDDYAALAFWADEITIDWTQYNMFQAALIPTAFLGGNIGLYICIGYTMTQANNNCDYTTAGQILPPALLTAFITFATT